MSANSRGVSVMLALGSYQGHAHAPEPRIVDCLVACLAMDFVQLGCHGDAVAAVVFAQVTHWTWCVCFGFGCCWHFYCAMQLLRL